MHGLSYDLRLWQRSRRHADSSAKDSHADMKKNMNLTLGTFISHVPGQGVDLREVDRNRRKSFQ